MLAPMRMVERADRRGWGFSRVVLSSVALLVAIPTVSVLLESAASAAPLLVQSASAQGSASANNAAALTATLGSACASGDTLIAFVTISEDVGFAGQVTAVPPGWQRIYEHAPSDTSPPNVASPYQGWFALSNCTGTTSVTFSIATPNDPAGTFGSLVLNEFSGLPNPVVQDFAINTGNNANSTTASLSGSAPAASGELTLTALSFYGTPPTSSPPGSWTAAGNETSGPLPAFTDWKVGTSSAPSVTYNWTPTSGFEVTLLALMAGPAGGSPNVPQENQGTFSSASSWSVSVPNGVSAGDSLVALIQTNSSGSGAGFEANGVSGGVVTWQQVVGDLRTGNTAEVWVGFASPGTSGTTTVTATMNGPQTGTMVVAEVSGIAQIDTSSANHGSSTTPTPSSLTPRTGDFLVAAMTSNPTAVTIHPLPNWSTLSLSSVGSAAEWQTNVPNSSSNPQWTVAPSGNFDAVQAAFVPSTSVPVVSSVSPASGPPSGGATVTISGANFSGTPTVNFGVNAASNVILNSPNSITATAPAGSVGAVDVTVTVAGLTSPTSSNDHFTYIGPPVVTGVSPSFGSGKGGSVVTISGINLFSATSVIFGSSPGTIRNVNGGGTALTVTTPPGTGTVDVTVTTPSGTSATSAADHYTFQGYWMVGSDGGVFAFGNAGFVGSLPGIGVHVNNVVGVVPTASRKGYWMVGSDGGVFAFGDAGFVGSLPGLHVHVNDIVGVVPTPTGKGYWMVGSDGGVFAFGDAGFVGSLPGLHVSVNDIVGVVPTSSGKGYWMVGKDGGVFAFGDAGFLGSLPSLHVAVSNIVAVVPTATGKGYWMVGKDGGVFAFGDAGFLGSLPGIHVSVNNIVAVVPTHDSRGYWMVGADGGVFAFGDAGFVGSLPGLGVHVSNIVGVVPT
jgi:hypothetical protein